MKFMKKVKHMAIAAALMCSAMALTACGDTNTGTNAGGEGEYKVTVKDALGNTYGKSIIVEFYSGDERVGMQVCDENGVAAKALESGTYSVKIKSTDNELSYSYDENLEVTADKKEVDVVISQNITSEAEILYVGGEEYDAYAVLAGCTDIELEKGERSYFLFAPSEAGSYEFSVVSDADTEIGYYGAPHFVQSVSVAEVIDGKFTVSVSESMIGTGNTGTTVLVLGVDALEDASKAILCVNRIGDPEKTLADEPWTIYETTAELTPYTLPEGASLAEFDITGAGYTLVYNETDGFYHLDTADGPLVVVYLTKNPPVAYVPCFKTILDRSGVVKYFFDENGEFVKKESYSESLMEYIAVADETEGVYPLTEDLKYIIQSRGEHEKWWDAESQNYIFKDSAGNPISGINEEIAWLFMCGYVQP